MPPSNRRNSSPLLAPPRSVPAGRPCVFLDRDGCVAKEMGYINHPDRIELEGGTATAIRRLNRAGVLAILTTNQSGVARGYLSESVLRAIHRRLQKLLQDRGAKLDAIYYAPYHKTAKDPRYRDDPEELRKPGLGMIRRACKRCSIDLSRSFVVGDKHSDVVFAHKAGLKGVFVLTGYGLGEFTYQRKSWKERPDFVAENLSEAVKWILTDLRRATARTRK